MASWRWRTDGWSGERWGEGGKGYRAIGWTAFAPAQAPRLTDILAGEETVLGWSEVKNGKHGKQECTTSCSDAVLT